MSLSYRTNDYNKLIEMRSVVWVRLLRLGLLVRDKPDVDGIFLYVVRGVVMLVPRDNVRGWHNRVIFSLHVARGDREH